MTEASPSCMFTLGPVVKAGYIGLPVPGCDMKLVPVDGKLEARFADPHVTAGYWRNPVQTACASRTCFPYGGGVADLHFIVMYAILTPSREGGHDGTHPGALSPLSQRPGHQRWQDPGW
jgi:acyl-CoA synthetase (AMP-forming)/AMP-acid ligase II